MSSFGESLFEAVGEIRDELVDEAAQVNCLKRKGPRPWMGAVAAALVLTVGLGGNILSGLGGGKSAAPEAGASGAGSDGGSTFISYEGPVFPLTLREENAAITAARTLTLDFASWEPRWISNEEQLARVAENPDVTQEELEAHAADLARWYPEGGYYDKGTDLLVRDEYVLNNSTNEDQIVELLYPFASDFMSFRADSPTLLVDGTQTDCTILPGDYAGGFRGAGGENDGRLNLDQPDNWEDYRAVMADGSDQQTAFVSSVDLSGERVVVYKFTDAWGPEESDDIPNPSVRVSFELDYSKTTVLSYGFHSGSFDPDSGWMGRGFSIPKEFRWDADHPKYLVVVGEDVENMQTDFYATGGWDPELEVEGGVTIDRCETDLDSALREMARLMFAGDTRIQYGPMTQEDFELYFALMKQWLITYGQLSEDVVERYRYGTMGDSDFAIVERVFYAAATVTVPANSSVTVTAELTKKASFDYACTGSDNVGVSGYDTVTTLGSNLNFDEQHAALEDRGLIDIVRENFGFDLEQGVTEVELDLNTEHYYLEVRRK